MTSPAPQPRLTLGVTTAVEHKNLHLLCPGGELRWGRWDIALNPPRGSRCDFWIVYAASRDRDRLECASENTLFIAGEPPSKKIYPKAYYAQFHRVISTRAEDPHPRVTASALCLNWHVGLDRFKDEYLFGYDYLKNLAPPAKENKVSVVCSDLTTTEGQRRRLALLDYLKKQLGESIVHYGRGFTPIPDKMSAIAPYRYHLVLENSASPHYWTEKLADAYLGWAYPIYVGCPNLDEYFPEAGFSPVSVDEPEVAARTIASLLAKPPSESETHVVSECRTLVLDRYNPFARFAYWADQFYDPNARVTMTGITTHKAFRPFPRGLLYRLKTSPGFKSSLRRRS
jgi:hypothetical protein